MKSLKECYDEAVSLVGCSNVFPFQVCFGTNIATFVKLHKYGWLEDSNGSLWDMNGFYEGILMPSWTPFMYWRKPAPFPDIYVDEKTLQAMQDLAADAAEAVGSSVKALLSTIEHDCTCPDINFSMNGTGCVCGGK